MRLWHYTIDLCRNRGTLSSARDRFDDDARANEWRTWYVATSRASERLHIVHGGFDWISPVPNRALAPHRAATDRSRDSQ